MPLSATTVETKIDDEIRGVLSRFSSIHLAIVFGSVASGHARPDSDLDLAVLGKTPLSANEKIELIAALAQQVGRPIDLVDLYAAPEPLLGQILCHGRRILGTDVMFATLLSTQGSKNRWVFAILRFITTMPSIGWSFTAY